MSTDERSSSTRKRGPREESEENRKANDALERARLALKNKKKVTFWDKYSYHIIFGGFGLIIVISLLSTVFGKTKKLHLTPVVEEDEITTHNAENYGYKLGPNPFFEVY